MWDLYGSSDFNPSILDHVMTSNGDEDAFVLKFGVANCSNNATSPSI